MAERANVSDGRAFLLGAKPAAIDAQFYHVVWFLRGRWADGPSFLSEFTDLVRWEESIRAIGHGTPSEMAPLDAISRAKGLEPTAETGVTDYDPQGLSVGQTVTIRPDVNGGEQPVAGKKNTFCECRDGRYRTYHRRCGYCVRPFSAFWLPNSPTLTVALRSRQ